MDLNARITALESQVEGIRPAVIGEDDIAEAMAGLREGVPAAPYHVEALYRLILPDLHGAMTRGASTLAFCREWGIDPPTPVGPIDSVATFLSRGPRAFTDDLSAFPRWTTWMLEGFGVGVATLSRPCRSVTEVREALLFLYFWDLTAHGGLGRRKAAYAL